jgi:hypothetical protein
VVARSAVYREDTRHSWYELWGGRVIYLPFADLRHARRLGERVLAEMELEQTDTAGNSIELSGEDVFWAEFGGDDE